MRVVGGKLGPDKKLGTYVSTVIAGGVADKAGIVKGRFPSPDTCLSMKRRGEIKILYYQTFSRLPTPSPGHGCEKRRVSVNILLDVMYDHCFSSLQADARQFESTSLFFMRSLF